MIAYNSFILIGDNSHQNIVKAASPHNELNIQLRQRMNECVKLIRLTCDGSRRCRCSSKVRDTEKATIAIVRSY